MAALVVTTMTMAWMLSHTMTQRMVGCPLMTTTWAAKALRRASRSWAANQLRSRQVVVEATTRKTTVKETKMMAVAAGVALAAAAVPLRLHGL